MRAFWPLVGYLLYLAASSAVSSPRQCDWNNFEYEKNYPSTIQIRTKSQQDKGKLTINIEESAQSFEVFLEPSRLYTLNMTFVNKKCSFVLLNDEGRDIKSDSRLCMSSHKFTVEGPDLEWSPYCMEIKSQSASGGGDADGVVGRKSTDIWILVMIALGVAVAVVAVGTLTWSIFSLCRKNR